MTQGDWAKKAMKLLVNFLPNATQQEAMEYFTETIKAIHREDLEHMVTDLGIAFAIFMIEGKVTQRHIPCSTTLFFLGLIDVLQYGKTGVNPTIENPKLIEKLEQDAEEQELLARKPISNKVN